MRYLDFFRRFESRSSEVGTWVRERFYPRSTGLPNINHLPAALDAAVLWFPDREAIIFEDTRITFSTLHEQTARLATGLISLGIARGDWVGILLGNCPEFIISFLALARIGAVVVPIDIYYQQAEIASILQNEKVTVVITSRDFVDITQAASARCENFKHLILTDSNVHGCISLDELMNPNADGTSSSVQIRETDDFLYLYTSGTTGMPKGVMLSHQGAFAIGKAWRRQFIITEMDRCYTLAPLFRSPALLSVVVAGVFYGITMVISSRFDPAIVWETLISERVSFFHACPFHYAALVQVPPEDVGKLPKLRLCYSTGNRLPPPIRAAFRDQYGIEIDERYGTSEVGAISSNGLPFQGVHVKIIDETGEPINESDQIGQILVKTPNMVQHYRNAAELSRQSFRDGWFYTGDLGKFDEEGKLRIIHRKKRIYVMNGNEVYADQVERALREQSGVKDARLVREVADSGKVNYKVFVVRESSAAPDEIQNEVGAILTRYKVEATLVYRDDLPRSWKSVFEGSEQAYPRWGD